MIKRGSIKEFEWIKQGIKSIVISSDENWKGNTVGNLLPNRFERYIKILHPMCKDKYFTDKNALWNDRLDVEGVPGERILWRELAKEYNVQFIPEITVDAFFRENDKMWPRYLFAPDEGTLEKEQVCEIVNILKSLSCKKYFYYYDLLKTSDWSQDILFEGNLEGLFELMELDDIRDSFEDNWKFSPSYWWDENKTVCICSDYDLTFTIVGCESKLFTSFMKSRELECIEVMYDTRIDYKAME